MKKQGSTWGRLCDSLFNFERCRGNERKNRRLLIDQLEERALLSVSTPFLEAQLVNMAISESQGTVTASSLAMDKDGDFVVVWSRIDEVVDENGDPVINPATNRPMTDENIYARYLTNEVQQIQLPFEALGPTLTGQFGKFSINFGGNEVQRLSIAATTPNVNSPVDIISGTFHLRYIDGADVEHITDPIDFSEADFNSKDPATDPAMLIQSALRALGGDLADVVVLGVDSQNFTISFGDASNGQNVNQLSVVNPTWDTSFLPSAIVSTVSEPFTVENITISPTNPYLTATAIRDAFQQYYDNYFVATDQGIGVVRAAIPTVSVVPVKTLADPTGMVTFNIEFVGATSYMNVPEIVIKAGQVLDRSGNPVNAADIVGVTLKETGNEFRVNPEEPDSPFTQLPDKFRQTNPSVAMNAEGNFVIAWESEVPESQNSGSVTDVFARMYTVVGLVDPFGDLADGIMTVDMDQDGTPDTSIQGVRLAEAFRPYSTLLDDDDPLKVEGDVYTFRANELTANAQGNPSVGMDAVGNFTISWSDSGQPISFFNGINMRQYTYEGVPKSAVESAVNAEDTEIHDNSYVAMSDSGYALILWESYVGMITYLYSALYDPNGYVAQGQQVVTTGASEASAYFDSADNYAICWTQGSDNDVPAMGLTSPGIYFVEFSIGGAMLRGLTRASSASTDPGSLTTWHNVQSGSQIIMDADGDMTVVFSGYGRDVNRNFATPAAANAFLREILAQDENADLIAAWPALADISLPFGMNNSGDIDGVIEEVLISAQKTHGFSDEMLGRLRIILETMANLARGEGNGVQYSQFDADPSLGVPNVLVSDRVVNSQRDGYNSRSTLALPANAMDGTFFILVQNMLNGAFDFVEVEPAWIPMGEDQIIDPVGTAQAIQDALNNSEYGYLRNNCIVRYINAAELQLRVGTYWELDYNPASQYVYEITFVGNLHDSPIAVGVAGSTLITKVGDDEVPATPPAVADPFVIGDRRTEQTQASIGMTPEGDFAIAYTEYALDAAGNILTSNIYFRYYDESTDTAGPIVTSAKTPDGINIGASPIVDQENGLAYIVVTMSERMYDNLTHTGDAVTNPDNYRLTIGDRVVAGAIKEVYYGLSESANLAAKAAADPTNYGDFAVLNPLPTISYEIVLVVDANGGLPGVEPLGTGSYVLELLAPSSATLNDPTGTSGLRDAAGNRLNRSGFNPSGSHTPIEFTLVVESDITSKEGLEVRVNETTDGVQTTKVTSNEEYTGSSRIVAMDNDGDFVVVWVSYDQDGDGAGVYMRMFDSEGKPMTGETLVNTYTIGDQLECAVAMDADGDFVVVWASEGQDMDGSWGIYGQRFDSMGRFVGGEFQINSNTVNDQVAPTVAMDNRGNFVVAWASQGQSFSYFNDIRAQVYGSDGQRLGSEIRVNSANIPGTSVNPSSNEVHPTVSVSEVGTFVVSWTAAFSQKNGVTTDTVVMARLFDFNGNPITIPEYEGHEEGNAEFQANVGDDEFIADYEHIDDSKLPAGAFKARNSQVAMSPFGEFIVAWEAFQDNDWIDQPQDVVNSYGIYYRQYNTDGTPKIEVDTNANQVVTALHPPPQAYSMAQSALYYGNQLSPSIGVDADGDFFITWSGNGSSTYAPTAPQNVAAAYNRDQDGVFMRQFRATLSGDERNPAVTPQYRMNTTYVGDQFSPTIAVTPSGDYVVVWSGVGSGDSQGVFFKFHKSSTDTAGPTVTDFLLPDGTPIASSGQVTQQLAAVVVTFDEAMYDNVTHTGDAVTNPANYALLIDGVEIVGGINQVFYGKDIAYYMSGEYGLNAQLTNKYQAILIVDANGMAEGVLPMTNGQYQVVVKGNLRDEAGNPLYSTGLFPSGGAMSDVIYVNVPTGQETLVSDGVFQNPADGHGQYTYATTADSVAADADGDFVVAWTDASPGREGVWIKMYKQTSVLEADGSRTTSVAELQVINPTTGLPWVNNEVLISNATNASDISVARDADGDFVVTWSAWNSTTSWDVYAQRFDAAGQPLGASFRVNSYTENVQRYSAVAMDSDGDFIITWQSLGQDGSGWGVYAKRFSNTGEVVNGSDETQQITFTGGFTGTFRIRWDDDNNQATPDKVTAPISYTGNAFSIAADVENALKAIGANVAVTASTVNALTVRFVGDSGGADVQPLWVSPADVVKTGGDASAEITSRIVGQGRSGDFLVNDTTEGNQMYPDIAMSVNGDFVITWTSTGQDGDNAAQSNIYAKQFIGNYAYWTDAGTTTLGSNFNSHRTESKVTTVEDPENYEVLPGDGFEGVVQIVTALETTGSGVLLAGTSYILTAAHVVWVNEAGVPLPAGAVGVFFDVPASEDPVLVMASEIIVHPDFNGDPIYGNDLALIKLDAIPAGVTGFQIYEGDLTDEVYSLYGYGRIGTGDTGAVNDNEDGLKYSVQNRFEATGSLMGYPDSLVISDFDSGTAANDALGILYGINDLGLGVNEGMAANGDSGGPMLVDGKIAAIVSFGLAIPGPWDSTPGNDASYGEFSLDTIVSYYTDWINSITIGNGSEFLVNADDILAVDEDGNPTLQLFNQTGNQYHSSVAMDADGDFVIVWSSYGQDGVGSGYGAGVDGLNGVYARRYNSNGQQASNVFQINQTAENDQQNARVSMDADGDFIVVWESFQDGAPASSFGIFARYYAATQDVNYQTGVFAGAPFAIVGTNPLLGMNGEMGGEFAVNTTKSGDQRFPGVAMNDTGDAVIVWSGNGDVAGQEDPQGIFYQRFAKTDDDAGPAVADILNVDSSSGTTTFERILEGTDIGSEVSKFVVNFGENLSTASGASGAASILNPSNWQLTKDGVVLSGAIANVQFGLNMAYTLGLTDSPSNKYEAVVTFDGDAATFGNQTLGQGTYLLTVKDTVKDLFGNKFDGNQDGTPGINFIRKFTILGGTPGGDPSDPGTITPPGDPVGETDPVVNTYRLGDQISPDVAADANGNYIVVWTSYDLEEIIDPEAGEEDDPIFVFNANIKAQLFSNTGQPVGMEFTVNRFTDGDQVDPAVAMDDFGNFVVVWAGQGEAESSGIFGRVYDRFGRAIGNEFHVNQTVVNHQYDPAVAMDADGDFVVTWTSYGQDGDLDGVYARKFSLQGTAQTGEILVNTTVAYRQDRSDVAMADNGNFAVVWRSDQQDGNSWGIFGQRFTATGAKLGGEFRANTYTLDKQIDPAVAMDADGDFVVAWSSMSQDGSGYGVYARRYNAAGVAQNANEFRVNQTTLNWQITPDVAMAADGSFAVTWTSFGQDNVAVDDPTYDYGIFSRIYNADGTDYRPSAATAALGEFRMNAVTRGHQFEPANAMSNAGHIVAAWTGPDQITDQDPQAPPPETTDIYSRILSTKASSAGPVSPLISRISVAETGPQQRDGTLMANEKLEITWNVSKVDAASVALKVNGQNVSTIYGPYAASSGVNFASVLGTLPAGVNTYEITVTGQNGAIAKTTGQINVVAAPAAQGPVISKVSVSQKDKVITWNAQDADGIASASITINGVKYNGNPHSTGSTTSLDFWVSIANLPDGQYNYTITAVDKAGNSSQLPGTFTLAGSSQPGSNPVIGMVSVSQEDKVITWNVQDADGVASASITINGVKYNGSPYSTGSTTSLDFWKMIDHLQPGDYNYTITAVDKAGNSSQLPGTFTLAGSQQPGSNPVIASVVPSEAQKVITWNVQDADGIASASITINGVKYNGNPHSTGSTTSLDFWVSIANLSAGQYNYTITAVDKAGKSSQLPGSFTLTGGSSGVVARSAVFSGIGRSLNNRVDASAKLDWLYDEIDVEDETTASAVDAVMAAY